jgi:hypothetical protein
VLTPLSTQGCPRSESELALIADVPKSLFSKRAQSTRSELLGTLLVTGDGQLKHGIIVGAVPAERLMHGDVVVSSGGPAVAIPDKALGIYPVYVLDG